jgi:hypothetical protein
VGTFRKGFEKELGMRDTGSGIMDAEVHDVGCFGHANQYLPLGRARERANTVA